MKAFLYKFAVFCIPFLGLMLYSLSAYEKSGGDLNRLGKISVPHNYRDRFIEAYQNKKQWTNVSEIDINSNKYFDILTIGDSFSDQNNYGYLNYLNLNHNYTVLNFDYKSFGIAMPNPIHILYGLINGGFFKNNTCDYLILEVVERNFVEALVNSNNDYVLTKADLNSKKNNALPKDKPKISLSSIINDIILFYRYNFFYLFNDHAYTSQVYKKKLSKPLFTVNDDVILFFDHDLINMYNNNTPRKIQLLNTEMNYISSTLHDMGIQLIVMPGVDKYDLYYDYIMENDHAKNPFFDILKPLKKNYLYLDTKALLKPYLVKGIKDLYYADDTHWTPTASKIVAKQLDSLISAQK